MATISQPRNGGRQKVGFSARQAADLAGITYRQLDYWCRTNMVRPSIVDAHGSGSRRRYSKSDVQIMVLARSMLDAGMHFDLVRHAIEDVKGLELVDGMLLILHGNEASFAYEGENLDRYWSNGPCWIFPLKSEIEE